MQFLITDIKFDCSLDDIDWTEKDRIETEEMLPLSYIGSTWEADDEDDLIEEISCASGWLIEELDYKVVLNDWNDQPEKDYSLDVDYTTQS